MKKIAKKAVHSKRSEMTQTKENRVSIFMHKNGVLKCLFTQVFGVIYLYFPLQTRELLTMSIISEATGSEKRNDAQDAEYDRYRRTRRQRNTEHIPRMARPDLGGTHVYAVLYSEIIVEVKAKITAEKAEKQ